MTWSHEAALLGLPLGPRAPSCLLTQHRFPSAALSVPALQRLGGEPAPPRGFAPAPQAGGPSPSLRRSRASVSGLEGSLRIPVSCAPALTRHERVAPLFSCVSPFAAMTARLPPGKNPGVLLLPVLRPCLLSHQQDLPRPPRPCGVSEYLCLIPARATLLGGPCHPRSFRPCPPDSPPPSLQTTKPSGPSPSPARDPAWLPNRPWPPVQGCFPPSQEPATHSLPGTRLPAASLAPSLLGSPPARCCGSSGSPSSRARLGALWVSGINPASREASLFVAVLFPPSTSHNFVRLRFTYLLVDCLAHETTNSTKTKTPLETGVLPPQAPCGGKTCPLMFVL